jgi:hypothetical protein
LPDGDPACGHDHCHVARTQAAIVNLVSGSSIHQIAFDLLVITDPAAVLRNSAVAVSSCVECRTVAVSVQLAVLGGAPVLIHAENHAVAVNAGCLLCESLAAAYQFVVATPRARFSPEGLAQLAGIEMQLHDLAGSAGPLDELAAGIDLLAAQALAVMVEDLSVELPPVEMPDLDPVIPDGRDGAPPPGPDQGEDAEATEPPAPDARTGADPQGTPPEGPIDPSGSDDPVESGETAPDDPAGEAGGGLSTGPAPDSGGRHAGQPGEATYDASDPGEGAVARDGEDDDDPPPTAADRLAAEGGGGDTDQPG